MWQELSAILTYCPKCGEHTFLPAAERLWVCSQCDFHFYLNLGATSGGIIVDDQGRILVTVRAKNPGKGLLGLPGGFLEIGETAEEGLQREIREEVGLEISEMHYLCSYQNSYRYRDMIYPTLDFFFVCRPSSTDYQCDPGEIAGCEWLAPGDIDLEQIAFGSLRRAIEAYICHERDIIQLQCEDIGSYI